MRTVLMLMAIAACEGVLRAQSTNASLSGRVTDPTGGLIVGAQVAAINLGTNFRYDAPTNNAGQYYLTNLPPGSYRIEIEKTGFRELIKPDVILHVQGCFHHRLRADAWFQLAERHGARWRAVG